MRAALKYSYWSGVLTCLAVVVLIRVYMGKEAYILTCQENWHSDSVYASFAAVWLGLAIVFRIIAEAQQSNYERKSRRP